jgi:hypothetical protein
MVRAIQFAGVVSLCVAAVWAADQKTAKNPPPPKAPPAAKAAPGPKGNPKGANGAPKGGPHIANPANPMQQLFRMSPEDRERALEKFPPQQQARIRGQLQKLDNLPPLEKQRLLRLGNELSSLPPDKQLLVDRQMRAYNALPEDRRRMIGPELQMLRRMPEDRRLARIMSEDFRTKYTPVEQQMMIDISQYLPIQR